MRNESAIGMLRIHAARRVSALERCVQLEPDRVQAIYQLGGLLLGEARYADAIQHFEHGMTLAPDFAGFRNGLAWIMATCPRTELRDGAKAVSLAEATWQTSPRTDPGLLDTLAVAYAEAGRMDDATTAAKKALSLLGPEARPGKREEIAGHLENFKNGRPVRDRPRGLE